LSKIIDPLRSRCLTVRVAAPTNEEIKDIVMDIARKENCSVPPAFADKITIASKRNLRRAILSLESARVQSYPFSDNSEVPVVDWELFIDKIAEGMISEQSPQRILMIREKMYELLSNCIPIDVIFKTLTNSLLRRLDDGLKADVIAIACEYEHRSREGSKAIFHLEAFVAKFMALYKRFFLEMFG